ncbi:transposase [Streptomyces microflavus]|uniref:transposase n=1 Tax=Streptomyces microflavus TaxID=1919 RepID=UPI00382CE2F5
MTLGRTDPTYNDFIVMPRWMPGAVDGGAALPDYNSIVSSHLHYRLHEASWAQLQGRPDAWSMLTTALTETRPGVAPVPIWSADAVVLAGRWSPREVVRAVEKITLPSLIGEAVPTVVLPALGVQPQAGQEKNVRVRVWRALMCALSAAADRTGGLVTVNGEPPPAGARGSYDPFDFMSDEQWRMLRHMLPPELALSHSDLRSHLDGVLWCVRSGRSWEHLPAQLGTSDGDLWHRRWTSDGTLDALRRVLVPYRPPTAGGDTIETASSGEDALPGISCEV